MALRDIAANPAEVPPSELVRKPPMSMIGFPLLLIPLAIYNIFVFLMPGVAFTSQIVSVTLPSGVQWTLTFGDALIAFAIVLLLLEIAKASRPSARFLTDHLLSLIIFGAATAEFLFLKAVGTSDFFLLTTLTAVEFVAGVVLSLRNRQIVATAAAPQVERQEPPLISPTVAEVQPLEPKRADTVPRDGIPPAMISVSPLPQQKPVAPAAAERKVSDWSVSDLVSDKNAAANADEMPKPDRPGVSKS